MERTQVTEIDQALFGYADGHRQLASSMRLPARDMYELASRSDLAPSARLDPQGSYITGFNLPESRIFAFVKTWLAPEMPRPGCVWSHALLLPKNFLSGQVDLSVLDTFFQRPGSTADRQPYLNKLEVRRFAKGASANPSLVKSILAAYYESQDLVLETAAEPDLQRAVLAVWSQQWPKLRAEFEFRTALTVGPVSNNGLNVRSGVGSEPAPGNIRATRWLEPAVADAIAQEVTPLRRFLWRYGKDIAKPRNAFIDLVSLYVVAQAASPGLSLEQVISIFRRLPGDRNGATLKRDILGVSTPPLALVPRIKSQDFVNLLGRIRPVENKMLTIEELRISTRSYGLSAIPELAQALVSQGSERVLELDVVLEDIEEAATLDELHDERTPVAFSMRVLQKRPQLIREFDLTRLPAAETEQLLSLVGDPKAVELLFGRLLRSNPSDVTISVMKRHKEPALRAAIGSSLGQHMDPQWLKVLPSLARSLLDDELIGLEGISSISHALHLFDFPSFPAVEAAKWWAAAKRDGKEASSFDNIVVMAYVLVRSFQEGLPRNIDLISVTLPQVRAAVLSNTLPERLKTLLDDKLPRISENWDFNKRLLKVLRRGTREGVDVKPILLHLALSDSELAYVLDEKSEEGIGFNFTKLFWPWQL
ncbi:hypothetical protein [Rhizobium leguminosarum]|uniref:GAP1-N1 domain-containing protein n=1 Tax=Rhizobium leguminosarum TaxID=384 RepID=UPI001C98B441|nr:hypothetical protein [Rhizobium leguminosarum]MBY5694676.1 hypothetical protein [Rhizobium leguminosarum]